MYEHKFGLVTTTTTTTTTNDNNIYHNNDNVPLLSTLFFDHLKLVIISAVVWHLPQPFSFDRHHHQVSNSTVMFPLFPSVQTERDVSVRQRAVDLLYAMCDRSNAKQIVAEMLSYLETADYSIREEIVGGHYSQWGLSCNELLLRVASALNPFSSLPDFHQV